MNWRWCALLVVLLGLSQWPTSAAATPTTLQCVYFDDILEEISTYTITLDPETSIVTETVDDGSPYTYPKSRVQILGDTVRFGAPDDIMNLLDLKTRKLQILIAGHLVGEIDCAKKP